MACLDSLQRTIFSIDIDINAVWAYHNKHCHVFVSRGRTLINYFFYEYQGFMSQTFLKHLFRRQRSVSFLYQQSVSWNKVWSRFWSLSLVEMLMFCWDFEVDAWSRYLDSEDEIWSRFVFELVWTLVNWTQPSPPLCLWQCLNFTHPRVNKFKPFLYLCFCDLAYSLIG